MSIFFGRFLSKIFFLSFAKLQNMSFLSPAYPSLRPKKIGRVFFAPFLKKVFCDLLKRNYQLASDYEGVVYIAIAVRPKYVLKIGLYGDVFI